MFQVDVRSDVADPVERIGFKDSVAEGIGPNPADYGEDIVYRFWGQALLEQLRLKQLDVAFADVDDPALAELVVDVHRLAHVVDHGARGFECALNLQPPVYTFFHCALE
ncbi:hypothetical protein D3C84_924100 [compost metagenome]